MGGAREKELPAKPCGQTIEVSGLSPSTRSFEVIMYFEGLCQGTVDDVRRDPKTNVTYVTFERNTGACHTILTKLFVFD